MLRASSVKGKNLIPLRTGSAKDLEILRRPDVSGLLRMTLLNALGCIIKNRFQTKLNLLEEEALLKYSGRKGILL